MNISVEFMVSLGLNLLLFIIIICLIISIANIKKRISKFLPENKNIDVEQMLCEYSKNVLDILNKEEEINNKINSNKIELSNKLNELNNKLSFAIQKVGFIRYNPFAEVGGELCYAIAFLDEHNNGVIINSIYARDTCYSYAKDITNGESLNHKLSDEETQALKMAMAK